MMSSKLFPLFLLVFLAPCFTVEVRATENSVNQKSVPTATLVAWRWSADRQAWQELASPAPLSTGPAGFEDYSAAIANNRLYVWGNYRQYEPGANPSDKADTRYQLVGEGTTYDFTKNEWKEIPHEGAPSGRRDMLQSWLGDKLVVWGGKSPRGAETVSLHDGAMFDYNAGKWAPISGKDAPQMGWSRNIWSGKRLIVWGSRNVSIKTPDFAGAVWQSDTNTWTPMAMAGAPDARFMNVHFPFGEEFFSWGSQSEFGCISSGGFFDFAQNKWRQLKIPGGPEACRDYVTVWTGKQLILWSGTYPQYDRNTDKTVWKWVNSGMTFDPATNTWLPMSEQNAPQFSEDYNLTKGVQAMWTGEELFLWRKIENPDSCDWDGFRYNPVKNEWGKLKSVKEAAAAGPASPMTRTIPWPIDLNKPSKFHLYLATIDPKNGALTSCKPAPKLVREDSEYRKDYFVMYQDNYVLLSNRMPKS